LNRCQFRGLIYNAQCRGGEENEDFRWNRSGVSIVEMAEDEEDPLSTCSGAATIRTVSAIILLSCGSVSQLRQPVRQEIIHLSDIREERCCEEGDVE
jgi:hypothetical protein